MLGAKRSGWARTARWVLPLAGMLALCGCGGGGSAAPAGSGGSADGWTPGVFQPSSKFAALCQSPRTGTDSFTGRAYPDRQGSTLDENNWLRSWTHELYLWYDEVQDADPGLSTTPNYFQLMKTMQTTSSGAPKDRFHFTYPTSTWEQLSQAGVEVGYGVGWEIVNSNHSSTVTIAYLEPAGSLPAATVAANLVRGDEVLAVDGVYLTSATDQTSVDKINAGLNPATAGEPHTFTVQDPGSGSSRTVQLQSAAVTSSPVLLETTVTGANGSTVGYILYNDQVATAESELISAIQDLESKNVTDLVLDLRYNGGGLLDLASELGYMIGGSQTAGQTFELEQFSNQYPTTNPITGQPITPTPFYTTTQGYSTPAASADIESDANRRHYRPGHLLGERVHHQLPAGRGGHGLSDRLDDLRQALRLLSAGQLRHDVFLDRVPGRQRQGCRRLWRRLLSGEHHARRRGAGAGLLGRR